MWYCNIDDNVEHVVVQRFKKIEMGKKVTFNKDI